MAGKRIAVFSLFALVALALAAFASSGTQAGTFKVLLDYQLSDYTPGNPSDTTNLINIPRPDINYEDSSMFTFNPIDGWSATGDTIEIGAKVGSLNAVSYIGISNGACTAFIQPNFVLYNGTVDTSDELGPTDMNWVLKENVKYEVPYSDGNPDIADYLEGYPHFVNEMLDPDGPCDKAATGQPDVCEKNDPGSDPPLQPRARYAGHVSNVAGNNILVQVVVLNPGQLAELSGIQAQFSAALGPPSLVILNNPVSADQEPGAISDFCSPLRTSTTTLDVSEDGEHGSGAGTTVSVNGAASTGLLGTQTHIVRNYSRSERDADGDGWENDFDPCPYSADPGWDPRVSGIQTGDADGDGLPASCDPNDGDAAGNDADGDGYLNKQDICPTVANGCQDTSCHLTLYNPAWDNQADSDSGEDNADNGPGPDSLGDACDDSDNDGTEDGVGAAPGSGNCTDGIDNDADTKIDMADPDCTGYEDAGDPVVGSCWDNMDNDSDTHTDWDDPTCQATAVFLDNGELQYGTDPWGSNPSTGAFKHVLSWAAACVGGTDADGDGYCEATENALGSSDSNGSEYDLDPDTYCFGDANCCDNATDDDGDNYVNDGCPAVGDHIERGAECAIGNAVSDDTPADGSEVTLGVKVNDGCPTIGVPESLVIDAAISADPDGDTVATNAPQSCSDGIDNDGDTKFDVLDTDPNGCDPTTYNPDEDMDGVDDATDNCPDDGAPHDDTWNPEQTDTDLDGIGDACDPDDDNDQYATGAFTDSLEWWMGTDPLADCPQVSGQHDAWPLDQDQNRVINLTGDAFVYVPAIGDPPVTEDWSKRRLDLDGNGVINLTGDAFQYVPAIGWSCTP